MEINKLISENKISECIEECLKQNCPNLALLISKISVDSTGTSNKMLIPVNKVENDKIKVLLFCNWCSNRDLCDTWKKMSKNNDYTWNNIEIVWDENTDVDYYCIINRPPYGCQIKFDPKKTIIFRMEPKMENRVDLWQEDWATPPKDKFMFVGYHNFHHNNVEWHLSKTYQQLSSEPIIKDEELSNVVSSILSDKYSDPGHRKRIDFAKFLESKNFPIHVFGSNKFLWKNYKGSLPYHDKDNSLLPYKYSFNCENHSIPNYFTEKIVDGILAETLVFYNGCENIKDYIDERAFVYLDLSNHEHDLEIIQNAIANNLWEERLPYIKEAKKKILNELQFFPRLEKIILNDKNK